MATWDDVRRIALALPESSERVSRGLAQWRVKDKLFVWERPLRRREIDSLGGAAPDGPIVAARVEHLGQRRPCSPTIRTSTSPLRTSTAPRRSSRASSV